MTPADSLVTEREIASQSVARIDAQDERFAHLLRDFFTEYGYKVLINQPMGVRTDYHVVCGDVPFVKSIFAHGPDNAEKRLAIILDQGEEIPTSFGFSGKTVLTDSVLFSKETTETIFRFFFTSTGMRLDLRKNPKKHVHPIGNQAAKPAPHVTREIPPSDDATRINQIMSSIFSHPQKRSARGKTRKRFLFPILVCIIFLPFLWYLVNIAVAAITTGYAALMLGNGHVDAANISASFAQGAVGQSKQALSVIAGPISLVGLGQLVSGQEHMVSFLSDVSSSLVGVSTIFSSGKHVAGLLLSRIGGSGQRISPAQQVESLQTELFRVQTMLGLARSDLQVMLREKSFPFWFGAPQQLGERVARALSRYSGSVDNVNKFLLLYPYMSGFRQKQTFLLLFQNSLELRPTGGFIGTIGTMTTEDGTISDFEVQDVYAVDGQLKGHVDPPGPIRDLLPSEHWYLRDSNWDANFSVSAARAAWFYEKETGVHVDGVIAINTPLVVNLLSVTGPITMRDYNDRITSENFYGKALFYTSSDFFPGSTQKQNFLGSLARALMDELTNDKNLSPVGMFKVLTDGLTDHNIMFYFADAELERLAAEFGWSAKVFSREGCIGIPAASCYFDPLYVNEANLGVNKVNYFVKRSLSRTIHVQNDGSIEETGVLSLQNMSRGKPQDNGGTYRLYARYFLPDDAMVDQITIGGVTIPFLTKKESSASSLPYAEYDQGEATGSYKILGVALDIAPGDAQRVAVQYHRAGRIPLGSGGSTLELFTQKQPGTMDTELGEFVQYPADWNVWIAGGQGVNEQFLAKEGSLTYNTGLFYDSDILVHIER